MPSAKVLTMSGADFDARECISSTDLSKDCGVLDARMLHTSPLGRFGHRQECWRRCASFDRGLAVTVHCLYTACDI